MRFHRAMKYLTKNQIRSLQNYKLSHFLDMPYHLMVPLSLLEWIAHNSMCKATSMFYHKGMHFQITKEMVHHVVDLPCGGTKISLKEFAVKFNNEFYELRNTYDIDDNNHISFKSVVSKMKNVQTKECFIWNFMLLLLTSVICASTQDYVNPLFLYPLLDISQFMSLDWCTFALEKMCDELENWDGRTKRLRIAGPKKTLAFGGCMPLYAIVYMDMVDLSGCQASGIDYGTPRICHVKNVDFIFLVNVDRNWVSSKYH